MPNLQELITEQKRLSGRSYADYEARARHTISRQRWQQLGSGERIREFSEPATIQAMAEALEVDPVVVILAMAKTLGFPVGQDSQSELARMLPPSARYLTAEQRDAIVRLVRSLASDPQQVVEQLVPHLTPEQLADFVEVAMTRIDAENARRARVRHAFENPDRPVLVGPDGELHYMDGGQETADLAAREADGKPE